MKSIVDLMFEARMLKKIPRSGYPFLGAGDETVAEHSFLTAFIGLIITKLVQGIDREKVITMCLVHDIAEARTGDLNYLQKQYVRADEKAAISDATREIPFGQKLSSLIEEFNKADTLEAKLARDSDQLALMLDLKALSDVGYRHPEKWLCNVKNRILTEVGKQLADQILQTDDDSWWRKNYIDS
jgi:putative hydrolase of HD superfamily